MNGDSLKKPVAVAKLKEKGDKEEEAEEAYPDDFEEDSEEEVNNFHKTDHMCAQCCKLVVVSRQLNQALLVFSVSLLFFILNDT